MTDKTPFQVQRAAVIQNSLHYVIRQKDEVRRLHLYNYDSLLCAAIVRSEDRQILAAAALAKVDGQKRLYKRILIEFTGKEGKRVDKLTQAILRADSIAGLRLPKSITGEHWKNSALFLKTLPEGNKPQPIFAEQSSPLIAKKPNKGNIGVLEDAFCNIISVISAINFCARAWCDLIGCIREVIEGESDSDCFKERADVSLNCGGSGDVII